MLLALLPFARVCLPCLRKSAFAAYVALLVAYVSQLCVGVVATSKCVTLRGVCYPSQRMNFGVTFYA